MNRKMKANAAKAEKRAVSNGDKKRCNSCGGKTVGGYVAIDLDSAEIIESGSLCEPPDRKEMH